MTTAMPNEEYNRLLKKCDQMSMEASDRGEDLVVIPLAKDGERLPRVEPGCLLYVACGESMLVGVNENLEVYSLW
jgi:hypothetical protein